MIINLRTSCILFLLGGEIKVKEQEEAKRKKLEEIGTKSF